MVGYFGILLHWCILNGGGLAYSYGDKIANRSGEDDIVVSDPNDPDYIGTFSRARAKRFTP